MSNIKGYHQSASILPYYEVKVVRKDDHCNIAVDLVSDNNFKFIMNLSDRNQPTDETDLFQYQTYLDRKGNNLYKLSNINVVALLAKCEQLSI